MIFPRSRACSTAGVNPLHRAQHGLWFDLPFHLTAVAAAISNPAAAIRKIIFVGVCGEAVVQASSIEVRYVLGIRAGSDLDLFHSRQDLIELRPQPLQRVWRELRSQKGSLHISGFRCALPGRERPTVSPNHQISQLGTKITIGRMINKVDVVLQRHGESLRHQVVALHRTWTAGVVNPTECQPMGQEPQVGSLRAVAPGGSKGGSPA